MRHDCFLVADDLTGACDAAVHFAERGLRTSVCISDSAEIPSAEVVAVNTETRDVPGDAARARLAAVSRLAPRSTKILFKKIDSTLRGNVGQEIAASLNAFECDVAVVCPAFPALGRVVEQGRLRVNGVDNFDPVAVAALLREQGLEESIHCGAVEIIDLVASGAQVLSIDAASDRDLDEIVAATLALDRRILWAGSGGLAAALARTLPLDSAALKPAPAKGPVLFCIGSDHSVTNAQLAVLIAKRSVRMLPWDQASRKDIADALSHNQHVCLRIPRNSVCPASIREPIAGVPAAALLLSGGDTASLVCRAAGVQYIDLYDEIVPGIPRGVLRGGDFDGTQVATKSGAFGTTGTLVQIADYFLCPPQ